MKWVIVGALAYGSLVSVLWVGKPRKPLTPGIAAASVALNAVFITMIIVGWD